MRSLLRITSLLTASLLMAAPSASAADKLKRIAIMPFQNVSGDKTLDLESMPIRGFRPRPREALMMAGSTCSRPMASCIRWI